MNDDVLDVPRSEQNGYGVFKSAGEVRARAAAEGVDLRGTLLFYYEAYGFEYDGEDWSPVKPDEACEIQVQTPAQKSLKGFDVVTDCDRPKSHSPLSCNSIAADVRTNEHRLFDTEEEAIASLTGGFFSDGEPGPYKIYAVYAADGNNNKPSVDFQESPCLVTRNAVAGSWRPDWSQRSSNAHVHIYLNTHLL